MPEPKTQPKKQNWRFASLKSLRAAPQSFLHHPKPNVIGSFVRGEQLLAGQFVFAGQKVDSPDASIWQISPPSAAYHSDIHSFSWLADLAAIGDSAARKRAQKWLLEWIDTIGQAAGTSWEPGLAGKRVIHWCSHAMFLLKGLSPNESRKIFKSLGRHVNFLSNNWKATPVGQAKFEALAGMVYAGLALEGCENMLRLSLKGLDDAYAAWSDPKGAIPTRNPEELSDLFTLLTGLETQLHATGHPPHPTIDNALTQLTPGLRCLRLGDGGLVRFHGGGRGDDGHLDQALADAEIRKEAGLNNFMGFERLSSGRVVAVVDAAPPPDSQNAHASTLGFEMSSGRWPMLINCGPGARLGGAWAKACALSAAHNTITVEGRGTARADVNSKRAYDLESIWLSAVSHGFVESFGLLYERRLLVASNGRLLSGEDQLYPLTPPEETTHPAGVICRPDFGHSYMLHFHLHPDVTAVPEEDAITLTLPNSETWRFQQEGGLLSLEDSVMLDRTYNEPRPTKQIVVAGRSIDYVGAIRWSFTRL